MKRPYLYLATALAAATLVAGCATTGQSFDVAAPAAAIVTEAGMTTLLIRAKSQLDAGAPTPEEAAHMLGVLRRSFAALTAARAAYDLALMLRGQAPSSGIIATRDATDALVDELGGRLVELSGR